MNDAAFAEKIEALMVRLEEAIDECAASAGVDLDYENNGGVLTIVCEDTDTHVVVSSQSAMHQVWVAAKSGGFHCDWQAQGWVCRTTGETLDELLSRVCTEQSSSACQFSGLSGV